MAASTVLVEDGLDVGIGSDHEGMHAKLDNGSSSNGELDNGSSSSGAGGSNYSPWVSVLNLCNATIGAGVLSFPFAFRQTGAIGGPLLTLLVWLAEVGSMCILVRAAEQHRSRTYQQLVFSVLGPKMAIITSVTMLIFLIGSMISYLIITGDVFKVVFAHLFGELSFLSDRRVIILLFAFFIILPLALKRNMTDLKWSSTVSVIMLAYLTVSLVIYGIVQYWSRSYPGHVKFFWITFKSFIALDIMVFAFQCHTQVIPIFFELANEPHPFFKFERGPLKKKLLEDEIVLTMTQSKKVQMMEQAIFVSMTMCFMGFFLVGEFGYMSFPYVESDILESFGNTNPFMCFARIGMAAVAMVCFPVQNYPVRTILEDAINHMPKLKSDTFSWRRHTILTLIIFGITLGPALLLTDLGMIFSLLGSTGSVMVVFVVPGLLLIYNTQGHRRSQTEDHHLWVEEQIKEPDSNYIYAIKALSGCFMITIGALLFCTTCYVNINSSIG